MTVQTNTNVASFDGNGVTQIFPIAFKFNNDTDLVVLLVEDSTGSVSQLTLNSDYTVSGEGDEEGGLINVVVAPASGKRLKVTRVVDILQLTDLRNQGKFFAEIHEDALDLLTMIAQQHESGINSSLRVAESDPEPARIPAVAQRANKILSFDAEGNPQVVAPVTDSSTELRQELAAASGAALLGLPRINGLSGRTVEDFAREKVSINDFYIPGQVDWTEALEAARDYLAGFPGKPPALEFDGGVVYDASVMPNWGGIPWLILRGNNATLRNTGTGDNLILDAGAGAERTFAGYVSGFLLEGGPTSGHGVFVRSYHHAYIQAEVRGCGTNKNALQANFAVCTTFAVTASVNRGAWYEGGRPQRGIVLDSRAALEAVTACTFPNPIIEGMSAQGILLTNADVCRFIGGTSEANAGSNVECSLESRFNVFDQIDLEVSGSGQGFIDRGRQNTWLNIYNDALCTITSTAVGCRIVGGAVDAISNSSATTDLDGVRYGLGGGGITNVGGVVPRKRSVYNITTASFDPDGLPDLKVNDGTTIKKHISSAVSAGAFAVPSSVPGVSEKAGIAVSGAVVGDTAVVSCNTVVPSNYILSAVITAADTVTLRLHQISGAAASPFPSGATFRIDIWGH